MTRALLTLCAIILLAAWVPAPTPSAGPLPMTAVATLRGAPDDNRFVIAAIVPADPARQDSGSGPAGAPLTNAGSVGTVLVSGRATWYDAPSPQDAAAGPELRVGHWRGSWVSVAYRGSTVRVRLTDWCACPGRIIDLDRRAFARLAPIGKGVLRVDVEFGSSLPQTDTD